MPSSTLLMLLILLLGILGKSSIIAAAAGILVVLQVTNMQFLYPILEERGLELGLLFLVISVLVPFASGKVSPQEISHSFFNITGLIAMLSGLVATRINSRGLEFLQQEPSVIIGLVLGSILGVVFLRGIPVGPLMAGGIAALVMGIFGYFR